LAITEFEGHLLRTVKIAYMAKIAKNSQKIAKSDENGQFTKKP